MSYDLRVLEIKDSRLQERVVQKVAAKTLGGAVAALRKYAVQNDYTKFTADITLAGGYYANAAGETVHVVPSFVPLEGL